MSWIKCSEKLPEPLSGPVLITYLEPFFGGYKREMGVGYFDHDENYEPPDTGKGWLFWLHSTPIRGGGVTHWQPLPEPPQEEKDEK